MAEERIESVLKRKPLYKYDQLAYSQRLYLVDHYFYLDIFQNPFGSGGGTKWFVEVRQNESAKHALFVRILEEEIRRYTDDIAVYEHGKPDIVFNCDRYGTVAVEVETGARKQPKSELESRFKKLDKQYDRVIVFVTDKYLKRQYEKLARTITRTEIRRKIASCFDAPRD